MGVAFVSFQKIFIFTIDFNDFIDSSGHFGIDLVSCEGRFRVIFGIWGGFGALSEPIRRRKA